MGSFEGKTVVISGAARGQGRNHAVRFAKEGANVVVYDICRQLPRVEYGLATEEDLQETVRLVKEVGGEVVSGVADVRDFAAVTQVTQAGIDAFGPPDVVIANAGMGNSVVPTWQVDPEAFQETVDIDLVGAWHTIRAALPSMVEAGNRGCLIATISTAGIKAMPNASSYVAAKSGLIGLMKAAALELAPHGIRANCVAPTNVRTQIFLNDLVKRLFVPDMEEPTEEVFLERASAYIPMGVPMLEVDDITEAILWLASDAARYVTGVTLPVDGGTSIS